MKPILIDALAARAGGQLTRTRAFLRHSSTLAPRQEFVIVCEAGVDFGVSSARENTRVELLDVAMPNRLRAVSRAFLQSTWLPLVARRHGVTTFLTFSHFLPRTLPKRVRTIVGVSNLAPFSAAAYSVEKRAVRKFRLAVLRRTILDSARRADCVLAQSNAALEALVREGIPNRSIRVIPNGIEPRPVLNRQDAAEIVRRQYGIRGNFILSVSHFYRYKNFERLLEAYSSLSAAHKRDYALLIVGRPMDQEYHREICVLAKRLGIDHHMHVVPGVPSADLDALYRAAKVFVFPTLVESCPNILLEALACGAAVVASNTPPMPEFGSDGALYFDPRSSASLTQQVSALLNNEDLNTALRVKGRANAAAFTWSDFTASILSMCRAME